MIPSFCRTPPSTFPGMAPLPMGPRSRVLVAGSRAWTDEPAVRTALTRTWREAGQPLVVLVGPNRTAVDETAADWVAEHEFAGHQLHRCTSLFFMETADAFRVLAFVQDGSDGATKCVDAGRAAGLDVRVWEAAS